MTSKLSGLKIFLLLIFSALFFSSQAQKNDTVYLLNGDRITGELKKFEYGILTLKTEGMSTLSVEFEKIGTFYSSKYFEIIDKAGFTYFGSFNYSLIPGNVNIMVASGSIDTPIKEIVMITQIKNIFWKRFYGSVDLGASYYKSTNIFQYNFSSKLNYRTKKQLYSLGLSSIYTHQIASDTTIINKNNDFNLGYERYISGKWWATAAGNVQQNTQLNLEYRLQVGIGGGYDIVRTNKLRLYGLGAILTNREKPLDSTDVSHNLEGLLSVKIIWLQHRHPKIDISSGIDYYPSITIRNRHRVEYNLSAKYEIFIDFYFGMTFFDSYDSKPTSGGPALNDWGTTFSIGYTF